MASAIGSSSPNPNDYNPISNLEKQYVDPPLGRRLTLIVHISQECLLPGGVETVLKKTSSSSSSQQRRGSGSLRFNSGDSRGRGTIGGGEVDMSRGTIGGEFDMSRGTGDKNTNTTNNTGEYPEPAVEATIECDMGDIKLREINVSGGEDDSVDSRMSAGRSSPFGFLYDSQKEDDGLDGKVAYGSGTGGRRGSKSERTHASHNSTSTSNSKKQFGGFSNFKSNLKKGWDRQVTSIVLQAQKVAPGGNGTVPRDLLTVGAYVRDGRTEEYNTCLGMTERAEIPPETINGGGGGGEGGVGDGLTFRIPIVVPPHLIEAADRDVTEVAALIQFQVWIRSGAAIFTKSRGLRSYYPVGFTSLYARSLKQARPSVVKLPIQSDVVQNGMMTVTVLGDNKFPGLCGNGWSLTDPHTDSAYNDHTGKKMFFNAPLDQNYVFPILPRYYHPTKSQETLHPNPTSNTPNIHPKPNDALVATERSTESTVVLPLALALSRLLSTSAQISLQHSLSLSTRLQYLHAGQSVVVPKTTPTLSSPAEGIGKGLVKSSPEVKEILQRGHACCNMEILYLIRASPDAPGMGGGRVSVSLNLQRPDSIFENCLVKSASIPTYTNSTDLPKSPAIVVPFYPRVVWKDDPRLLPGLEKGSPNSRSYRYLVGKVRMEIYEEGAGSAGADVFSPIGPTSGVGTVSKNYDVLVDIEPFVNDGGRVERAPVVDGVTGQCVGELVFRLSAKCLENIMKGDDSGAAAEEQALLDFGNAGSVSNGTGTIMDHNTHGGGASFVKGGLISLMGLETLMVDDKACYPYSDVQPGIIDPSIPKPPPNASAEAITANRRRRQIATMGEFLTFDYMDQHAGCSRATNAKIFLQRVDEYQRSLHSQGSDVLASLTPDERRDPRPFRPSSSRMDPLLCGIGFNVHVHNISLSSVISTRSDVEPQYTARTAPNALFQNVTCGAPSDHFAGFSGHTHDQKRYSGGLRRLEANRLTAAQRVRETQDSLIVAVAQYYNEIARAGNTTAPGASSMRHVPSNNVKIMRRRKVCIEATQVLHELTWNISVRRGNVFSQALGIGVTLYLAHVSDFTKLNEGVWADVWKHHGFMITFEGLLSAAGKELGMIEDASVGIAMLRSVSVVIRPEDYDDGNVGGRVPVPESPYIVWLNIIPSGSGETTRFLVEVGVDVKFYRARIPVPLQNGNPVRFYPILYQMGVDIRQWGANAGANMSRVRRSTSAASDSENEIDEDDSSHANQQHDVLKALNYEAFRKMNAYAHSVVPCDASPSDVTPSWEQAHESQQQILLAIHPSLSPLFEYIRSSAGKMEHGILDEAATAAARLGGGSAIFCKSGKDRTAMQVTYKQAQFVSRLMKNRGDGFGTVMDKEQVMKDATTMRVYGTRLPICEKNVGQSMYAFNSLQSRFMPDMLKPPPRTLAGFLKGGRIFSKGGIES